VLFLERRIKMDQERIGMKVADIYKLTGEMLLKSMYYALEESYHKLNHYLENKTYTDKTNWNQFMATKETKHFETFLNSELNSERLEEYLKQYEVGFSIKDNGNGTSTIAIDAKNVQALEASFKGVINDLTDPTKAEKINEKIINSSKNMNLKQKIAYYKQQVKRDMKSKVNTKTAKKTKAKEERGL